MNNGDVPRQKNLVNEETNKYTYFISDNENEIEEINDLLESNKFNWEDNHYNRSWNANNMSAILQVDVSNWYPNKNKNGEYIFYYHLVIQGQYHDKMLDLILNEMNIR